MQHSNIGSIPRLKGKRNLCFMTTAHTKNTIGIFTLAMALVIVVSNILVQYPLGNWLTYGALTYPLAFLVTDLATRWRGATFSRKIIMNGVVAGIACSVVAAFFALTTWRIALASAFAFLVAQLIDVFLFQRMQHLAWWQTPVISSTIGSVIDSFLFFAIAFSALTFALVADGNDWAQALVPLLGIGPVLPLWTSLAVADLGVKLLALPFLLLPYRLFIKNISEFKAGHSINNAID